ncbi:hypothetical protein BO221_34125 [Archangium sp. Cb G35]|uniref:DUF418 domain-containing protein n=1 Tax=Archangium sp. Cb G35 TaxID=1920190 RepID=UPI000935CD9A|nr:DUF418 domain-containing protein [Archangium sp. Cb G35]OJT19429.1 hypothetical protein BO221_34125 [Archangium sp. Cb G35]
MSGGPGVAEARPVDAGERLEVLDVLRGFALGGVFVSNVYVWMSGWVLMPRPAVQALTATWVDQAASELFQFFVNGRFMPIFSFLFGLGFCVQLTRAEKRGTSVVPVYRRRLMVMYLLGLVHLYGAWYGDVLNMYAMAGLLLLLFRERKDRTLLIWAGVLMFGPMLVGQGLMRFGTLLLHGPEAHAAAREAAQAAAKGMAETKAGIFEGLSSGGYWRWLRANAEAYFLLFFSPMMLTHIGTTVGRFALGLWAGRKGLFHDVEKHGATLKRLWGWGLGVGLVGSGVGVVTSMLMRKKLLDFQEPWTLVLTPVRELGAVGLATFYVTSLALLFQRERWRKALRLLAPAGRMAVTNYMSQSVLGMLVFSGVGLGLMGKTGPAVTIALTMGLFCVQVAWSHWWLARYRFGPVEWVWRSLTYGKAQPMKRSADPRPETEPVA